MFENETIETGAIHCAMNSMLSCECVDSLEDECDMYGETICFGCQLATPAKLQFIYCNKCVDKLDSKDPTMNIPLLQVLNDVDCVGLIEEFGYASTRRWLDKVNLSGQQVMCCLKQLVTL